MKQKVIEIMLFLKARGDAEAMILDAQGFKEV